MKPLALAAIPVLVLVGVSGVHASTPARHALQTTSTATPTTTPTATPSPTETPTPSPTPTSTPTPPKAKSLLTAASKALIAKNTFHEDARVTLNFALLISGSIRVTGDVALKQQASFTHTTGTLSAFGQPEKQNEYDIQIKNQSWVKSAKTKNRWQKAKAGSSSVPSAGTSQNPLNFTSSTTKLSGLKVTGSSTVGDIAVWKLQGTITDTSNKQYTLKGKVNLLIGQDDRLPYEIDESINDAKQGIAVTVKATLSSFGKKVSIKAPKVGSTSP